MQDTTVGALVVMLHEQFMAWVPFLDGFCKRLGIVDGQVIFQT